MNRVELCLDIEGEGSAFKRYHTVIKMFEGDLANALEHGMAVTRWILFNLGMGRKIYCESLITEWLEPLKFEKIFNFKRVSQEKFVFHNYYSGQLEVDVDIDTDANLMLVGFTLQGYMSNDFYQIMRCLLVQTEEEVVNVLIAFASQHSITTARLERFIAATINKNIFHPVAEIPVWINESKATP